MTTRKHYSAAFKAQVVLQSLKEDKTLAQLAAQHGVHPNQISQWRGAALGTEAGDFGKFGVGSSALMGCFHQSSGSKSVSLGLPGAFKV